MKKKMWSTGLVSQKHNLTRETNNVVENNQFMSTKFLTGNLNLKLSKVVETGT